MEHRIDLVINLMIGSDNREEYLVPLLLESWNTLMPYLAHLAEVYDLIGA
ncbi:MAG: hypothetical protein QUT27_00140 [candidate division Zixibacteria bacterium]|nr:hypothetical protein [candidate division Zixibacteria bacterium]